MPVEAIATADVLTVLRPIWLSTPETATRLRGRIEAVLDFATVNGWRSGENPARWRGHLAKLLPARSKVRAVKHHAALPWQDGPVFLAELLQRDSVAARAVEFLILTAARSGEVLGMRWGEVDLDAALWTVPSERMKAKREHRVALSLAAVDLLRAMLPLRAGDTVNGLVFPGQSPHRPLSSMAMPMLLRRMGRGRSYCARLSQHVPGLGWPRRRPTLARWSEAALAHRTWRIKSSRPMPWRPFREAAPA